jgi:hypothetical protein
LADGWERWRKGKNLTVNPRGEYWCHQNLVVRVAPPVILRSKGERDLLWLYYKEAERTSDADPIGYPRSSNCRSRPKSVTQQCLMFVAAGCIVLVRDFPEISMRLLNAEVSAFLTLPTHVALHCDSGRPGLLGEFRQGRSPTASAEQLHGERRPHWCGSMN